MKTQIVRHAILDARCDTFAYQLGYRVAGTERGDPDQSAGRVIADLATLAGVEPMTGGKKAFIPVTRDTLINEFPRLLRPGRVVVDVPGELAAEELVVTRCRRLRGAGYALSVELHPGTTSPLTEIADFVKLPLGTHPRGDWRTRADEARRHGRRTVAGGVSSWQMFNAAIEAGVDLVTCECLTEPETLDRRDVSGAELSYVRIVTEVYREEIDVDALDEIIRRDVSLAHKLLGYINSSHIGSRNEVRSIRHALVLMGKAELKRWVALVALTALTERKPPELVIEAMTRARFAELIAPHVRLEERDQELFLVALLSVLDAVLDRPLTSILAELPLADDVRGALLAPETSELGAILAGVLAYTRGDWEALESFNERWDLDPGLAPGLYLEAVSWSRMNAQSARPEAA